jgi:LuxR family maltose regulon positive regulatory protein
MPAGMMAWTGEFDEGERWLRRTVPALQTDTGPDLPGTPGELRVLRYLPANLSRPEIAGELSVSLNTVSTHLRSIYAKLQVEVRQRTSDRS